MLLRSGQVGIVMRVSFLQFWDMKSRETPAAVDAVVLGLCRAGIVHAKVREGGSLMAGDAVP